MPPKRNARNKVDDDDVEVASKSETKRMNESQKPGKGKEKRQGKSAQPKEAEDDVPKTESKSKKKDKKKIDEAFHENPEESKENSKKEKNKEKQREPDAMNKLPVIIQTDDEKQLSDEVDEEFYAKKRKAGRGKKKGSEQTEEVVNVQPTSKKKRGKGNKKHIGDFDSDDEEKTVLSQLNALNIEDGDDLESVPSGGASRFSKFQGLSLDVEELPLNDSVDAESNKDSPGAVPSVELHQVHKTEADTPESAEDQTEPAAQESLTTTDMAPEMEDRDNKTDDVGTSKHDIATVKISRKELKKIKKQEEFDKLIEAAKKKITENSGTLDNFALSQVRFKEH
ncbi:unnamed protein product [Echinostoma caproni]|uniref:Transcription initiation factor TFIID subunit 2 n=1 Tax=Echinostoma caproni TaxID=27848 RepID=A0A183B3K0_9TREM|nr:unnamed protein product [Echinostoma caproni]